MDNRILAAICSLCLIIGALIGAIAMAIVRPAAPAPSAQLERPQDDVGPAVAKALADTIQPRGVQDAGEKPTVLNSTGPYPNCILIDDELKVLPREAKIIRDFLKKEDFTGEWQELEWTRIVAANDEDYRIVLTYKSMAPAGMLVKKDITAFFKSDGSIILDGGPLRGYKLHVVKPPRQ